MVIVFPHNFMKPNGQTKIKAKQLNLRVLKIFYLKSY